MVSQGVLAYSTTASWSPVQDTTQMYLQTWVSIAMLECIHLQSVFPAPYEPFNKLAYQIRQVHKLSEVIWIAPLGDLSRRATNCATPHPLFEVLNAWNFGVRAKSPYPSNSALNALSLILKIRFLTQFLDKTVLPNNKKNVPAEKTCILLSSREKQTNDKKCISNKYSDWYSTYICIPAHIFFNFERVLLDKI
jgi:hypothetical protein